ncbi:MAG: sulfite exporter TauE/SafE family protein [Ignavibacteria bacterium]|nr:sulfite exporter TauE/SafE family protein [Ignavibacteria bacterium]
MELFSGFVIGLLGSFHCSVMCGPIALSVPQNNNTGLSFISGRLVYNSGRIVSYSILGLIFGFFGDRLNIFGLQQSLTITIGVLILVSVILSKRRKKLLMNNNFISRIYIYYKIFFSKLFRIRNGSSFLMFGIMNGLLPCGFVYIALSGAMVSADVISGSVYMMLFGLGTVPMMLSVSVFGSRVSVNARSRINKLIPVLTVILGLLFILRGLNLGIPYISPADMNTNKAVRQELICN